MENPHWLLLVALIASSAIVHLVQAQNQEGFISLDCGLPSNELSPYTNPTNGLRFSSDSGFIQSGKIKTIDKRIEGNMMEMVAMLLLFQQIGYVDMLWTLRYFPDGKRNCYSFNVKEGTNYLIRASFFYDSHNGHNKSPKFDLHIGPNFWVSIDFGEMNFIFEEIMHAPRSNFLDVCLVKTHTTDPFISSLEIRPLPNNTYITTLGSLNCVSRYYLTESTTIIQFPNDAYDRFWGTYFDAEWKQIFTNLKANNSGRYVLPQAVITTAATPADASESLTVTNSLPSPNDKIFYFLHFSEVQELGANETREFDILSNGEVIAESFRPAYMQPESKSHPYPLSCESGNCVLELKKTKRSTLPPILNAVEIYSVVKSPQSKTNENDVLAIRKIKETYGVKKITWQGDPCVPKEFLWEGVICKVVDQSTEPIITSLNISSSGLTGTISEEIQNLTYLQKLDLSNNNLVGAVPEYLANMKSLSFINLSKNNLNGAIPKALRDREKKGVLMIISDGDDRDKEKKKFPVLIIIAVVASFVVVIVVILVLIFVSKRTNKSNHVEDIPLSSKTSQAIVTSTDTTDPSFETKRRKFSYLEVMEMTNNFERPLGEGGFGVVYYGEVNGSEVAVKLLSKSSVQGYKEFKAEVDLLLRVHHINLVSLVGYCDERDHLALIYEFMPNIDLKHHLSGKHGASVLSWSTRLQIAIGSALGLEYLHNGCKPSMVHRDIKSTNILLDEHFTAKIADFGLSRSFQLKEESHVSTVVAGTPGYLDPEYYRTGRLVEKSDVYSFGIVLLEIMTNQRVIDQTREKSHISEWTASMLNRGDITKIMDSNLDGDYNSRSVWRALELAMLCTNPSSENRPSISEVVVELKQCLNSENKMRSENQDIDSQSSIELMSVDTKVVPSAR